MPAKIRNLCFTDQKASTDTQTHTKAPSRQFLRAQSLTLPAQRKSEKIPFFISFIGAELRSTVMNDSFDLLYINAHTSVAYGWIEPRIAAFQLSCHEHCIPSYRFWFFYLKSKVKVSKLKVVLYILSTTVFRVLKHAAVNIQMISTCLFSRF